MLQKKDKVRYQRQCIKLIFKDIRVRSFKTAKLQREVMKKMIHEEKKVAKIIEELTMFFFTVGSDEIETRIKRDDHSDYIWISANYNPEYRDELDYLEEFLNKEKNDGLEDIYWELAGSGDPGESSQLLLIGMMLDKAEIEITDTRVELKLYKKFQDGY